MRHTVERAIERVNRTQPEDQSTNSDAPIMGGPLDSLGLVELLVVLEDEFASEYNVPAELLGNPDVIAEGGPLDTVGSLISYLEAVVNDAGD